MSNNLHKTSLLKIDELETLGRLGTSQRLLQ